jgi:hypothetical protein
MNSTNYEKFDYFAYTADVKKNLSTGNPLDNV